MCTVFVYVFQSIHLVTSSLFSSLSDNVFYLFGCNRIYWFDGDSDGEGAGPIGNGTYYCNSDVTSEFVQNYSDADDDCTSNLHDWDGKCCEEPNRLDNCLICDDDR